jgi:aspartate/methionine/tyrosine aminotransferase
LELNYKVLIKPGTLFGPSGAGYARVSFGVDEGRSIEALRRMELYMDNKPLMKTEKIRLAA